MDNAYSWLKLGHPVKTPVGLGYLTACIFGMQRKGNDLPEQVTTEHSMDFSLGCRTQHWPLHVLHALNGPAPSLYERGYYPISNKYLTVARIDDPQWRDRLKMVMLTDPQQVAEHYLRVYSKDKKTVDVSTFVALKKLWRDNGRAIEYVKPKPGNVTVVINGGEETRKTIEKLQSLSDWIKGHAFLGGFASGGFVGHGRPVPDILLDGERAVPLRGEIYDEQVHRRVNRCPVNFFNVTEEPLHQRIFADFSARRFRASNRGPVSKKQAAEMLRRSIKKFMPEQTPVEQFNKAIDGMKLHPSVHRALRVFASRHTETAAVGGLRSDLMAITHPNLHKAGIESIVVDGKDFTFEEAQKLCAHFGWTVSKKELLRETQDRFLQLVEKNLGNSVKNPRARQAIRDAVTEMMK